jgi:hypothetical protein
MLKVRSDVDSMSQTLEEIVARIEDPETPVVWLDPSTPEEFWQRLPEALRGRGFFVLWLDEQNGVNDQTSLMARFTATIPWPSDLRPNVHSLKEILPELPNTPQCGWAVLFRHPEPLRQEDETTFEDLLEALAVVHEATFERRGKVFKLVVQD